MEDGDLGEKTLKALERLILREKAVARLNKVKPQHEFQFRMSLDIDDANVDEENKRFGALLKMIILKIEELAADLMFPCTVRAAASYRRLTKG